MIKKLVVVLSGLALGTALLVANNAPARADSPTGERVIQMTVAPHMVDCVGVAPMKCLRVKTSPKGEWTTLYGGIKGFVHEDGYTYRLTVAERAVHNPQADRGAVEYQLLKVISKHRA